MVLIKSLLYGLVYMAAIALDVLFLFVLGRLAAYRFHSEWLSAFNQAGAQLVDRFSACVRQSMASISDRSYSDKTTLAVGLLALACIAAFLDLLASTRGGT
jgi:hypothetical protein